MEIVIRTKGYLRDTEIAINGRKVVNIKEFHLSVNPTRERDGRIREGKVKMQLAYDNSFNSLFCEDFVKYDELIPPVK